MRWLSSQLRAPNTPPFVLVVLLAFALSACTVDTEVDLTVYDEGVYEVTATFDIPQEAVLMGFGPDFIEERLDNMVSEMSRRGSDASWRRRSISASGLVYEITEEGKAGPVAQEGDAFHLERVQDGSGNTWLFQAFANELSQLGDRVVLTLRAKQVLDTNGQRVEDGVVRWNGFRDNPYAYIIPYGRTNWLLIGMIAIVSVLAVVLVVVWRRDRAVEDPSEQDIEQRAVQSTEQQAREQPRHNAEPPAKYREEHQDTDDDMEYGAKYCPSCGTLAPGNAKFCSKCGSSFDDLP